MNRILDALRSPGAMMVALMLALVAQGEHTAQVFAFFSHSNGRGAQPLAYAFAAAVEVAVLLFVLRGHKYISYAFAVATLCTNIVYYAIGGVDLLSVAVAPVLLLSALLPGVIVGYSHTIAETPHTATMQTHIATPAKARRYRWQIWRKSATELVAMNNLASAPVQTPVAIPAGTLGHPDANSGAAAPPVESPKQTTAADPTAPPVIDTRTQAMQLRDEGYTASEIARMTGAKYSTVQSWLRRATVQTNGVHQ